MTNHMTEVAKLLGLEIEETFRINGEEPYFRFTEEDFESSTDIIEWTMAPSVHLRCILTGEVTIVKNRKPQNGEFYFSPSPTRKSLRECLAWVGGEDDNYRLNRGFVFKTPDEAVGVAKKMLALLKEDRND